jgi:hypothetical protein
LERVSVFDRRRGLRAAALANTALGVSCATAPVMVQREFALMREAPEGILPFSDDEAEFAGPGSIQSFRPLSLSEAGSTPPRSGARIKVVVES